MIYKFQPQQTCPAMREKEANTRMATTPDNIKIAHCSTQWKPVECLFQRALSQDAYIVRMCEEIVNKATKNLSADEHKRVLEHVLQITTPFAHA